MLKLEPIYLMNVALVLTTKDDIFTFLCICKNCKDAVKRLKTSPFFDDNESAQWFVSHFRPDTFRFNNYPFIILSIATEVSNFSFPNFNGEVLKQNFNVKMLQNTSQK
ncbi:hypothetical protein EIN_281070 [Entamoeba invadens IP1]|uniref:Uncharacterized protein n=1 Tax=Entamoeba invadens IP1 TaxID=370355 RepID=A0A0A1TZV7_ENTIV|nr:hypothetical protein EIN_281070 [Entamoeba invadens IP1]ELP85746.1 hypothetical protein EIN_281070 [Entamoeba invadens IP1]|eukprot:XP_004185092.1 hypothetical protein EIN_281070 [Entamoeba invadens IP1]